MEEQMELSLFRKLYVFPARSTVSDSLSWWFHTVWKFYMSLYVYYQRHDHNNHYSVQTLPLHNPGCKFKLRSTEFILHLQIQPSPLCCHCLYHRYASFYTIIH